jgi:hypothetical protein
MNSKNDERFFDLAMKVIARQCTDAERAELDALLVRAPELKGEYERLQRAARTVRDTLPLIEAAQATEGELPAYARERLQTKVRQTLGRYTEKVRLALGAQIRSSRAVVLVIVLPLFRGVRP